MTRKRFVKVCMSRRLDKNHSIKCAEIARFKFDSYDHAMQYIGVLGVRRFLKMFSL